MHEERNRFTICCNVKFLITFKGPRKDETDGGRHFQNIWFGVRNKFIHVGHRVVFRARWGESFLGANLLRFLAGTTFHRNFIPDNGWGKLGDLSLWPEMSFLFPRAGHNILPISNLHSEYFVGGGCRLLCSMEQSQQAKVLPPTQPKYLYGGILISRNNVIQ